MNEKMIVVINGKGGVGKDTLCDFVAKKYKVMNVSSITKVKEIAKLAGWDGNKDAKGRKLLSDMKKALTEYDDLPTKYLLEDVNKFLTGDDEVMFVHIREGEEIEKFINKLTPICVSTNLRCITLLINRDGTDITWGNESDDEVWFYPYNFTYNNNLSLEEAEDDFLRFFEEIKSIKYIGVDLGTGPSEKGLYITSMTQNTSSATTKSSFSNV